MAGRWNSGTDLSLTARPIFFTFNTDLRAPGETLTLASLSTFHPHRQHPRLAQPLLLPSSKSRSSRSGYQPVSGSTPTSVHLRRVSLFLQHIYACANLLFSNRPLIFASIAWSLGSLGWLVVYWHVGATCVRAKRMIRLCKLRRCMQRS